MGIFLVFFWKFLRLWLSLLLPLPPLSGPLVIYTGDILHLAQQAWIATGAASFEATTPTTGWHFM